MLWPRSIADLSRLYSYNRYLAVAARAVRRSLKEGPRLQAERRGNMDLRFAKWEVRINPIPLFCSAEEDSRINGD